ncbi:MAG: MBL fold metallo-hydrolase [Nitrospirae bacterium]|nr:MBL fold metallo-hydrolase [Nitrospirota bacterium]
MEIARLTVIAEQNALTMAQSCLQSFCDYCSLNNSDFSNLSLAVEEVFNYCVGLVKDTRPAATAYQSKEHNRQITLRFSFDSTMADIIIEHHGRAGLLEKYFSPGTIKKDIPLTSFEAVGLHLASEVMTNFSYYAIGDSHIFNLNYLIKEADPYAAAEEEINIKLRERFKRLASNTLRIEAKKLIYINPRNIKKPEAADLILITGIDDEYCSVEDIKKLFKERRTIIVAPTSCAAIIPPALDVVTVKAGDTAEVAGIKLNIVPGHNPHMTELLNETRYVGYIFNILSRAVYVAGDTALIPEMKNLREIDTAFIPINGKLGMPVNDALRAALYIKPRVVVPLSYANLSYDDPDIKFFETKLKGHIEVYKLEAE